MKCAFDKDRECNKECAAFMKTDMNRDGTWTWDTCLKEYVIKWTRLYEGTMCTRLGHFVGPRTLIAEDDQEITR